MLSSEAQNVNTGDAYSPGSETFSICTLYRNQIHFDTLTQKLNKNGYLQKAEFLSINNIDNKWDCYQAIRYFIDTAIGDYIVICHEDIELYNLTIEDLKIALQAKILTDKDAAIFGVAGISRFSQRGCGHFFSNRGEEKWGEADNGRALTLDECFLVIKKSSGINVSSDLSGFHFYGTDLCLNAEQKGFRNYIIEFPIGHKSAGTLDEGFFSARDDFEEHLRLIGYNVAIPTTCTIPYGGKSAISRGFYLALSYLMTKSSTTNNQECARYSVLSRGFNRYGTLKFKILILFASVYRLTKNILHLFINYSHSFFVGFVFWKIIFPLSWPLRRLHGDIRWWFNRAQLITENRSKK